MPVSDASRVQASRNPPAQQAALRLSVCVFALALSALAPDARAEDVDARTMAFLYDVAAPNSAAPGNADPGALAAAREALRSERLLGSQRVATVDPGVIDQYSRALLLGTRGKQFASQIGRVRDAVLRRDRNEIGQAIGDLYEAAGRKRPSGKPLDKLIKAVGGAASDEGPAESVRRRFDKPDHTIEIADARRAGLFMVDVATKDGNGQPVRTLFVGEQKSMPNARGTDLEQRMTPRMVCTISAAQSDAMRLQLNGVWTDGSGQSWEVSGQGGQIELFNRRARPASDLRFVGTYKMGRIEARHDMVSPDDMAQNLPRWVRVGLVAWTPKVGFVVRLDSCPGAGELTGTWQSQHVTYSPSYQTISRVHDPYELRLTLKRAAPARGIAALP